jgi:hypothetical protein
VSRRWTKTRRRVHPDGFRCEDCGTFHEGPPFDYFAPAPDPWLTTPAEERDGTLADDLCWMREHGHDHYMLRGLLTFPVLDSPEDLRWSVWAQILEEDFARVIEAREKPRGAKVRRFQGWLVTVPAIYPDAWGLDLMAELRGENLRAIFRLTSPTHPMAIEHRNGITLARVREIAKQLTHGTKN